MTSEQLIERNVRAAAATVESLLGLAPEIERAAGLIGACFASGGKVLLFGNGGSAAHATHIAAEFLGRFLRERRAVPAVSLTDNASTMTAIANDYAYDRVFARQIEGLGRPGDVAVGISTSGSSANVVAGLTTARERGLHTIGLTGEGGGAMAELCDVLLAVPSDQTPRIQEGHTVLAHLLCELVENRL
jgi:D-sedoheptulose 7-phosphate isomerase